MRALLREAVRKGKGGGGGWRRLALRCAMRRGRRLAFSLRLGFRVKGCSETDGQGRPDPLRHLSVARDF